MSEEPDFEVIWHDPPPTGKYGLRLEHFVTMLKKRPGEWGELPPLDGEFYPLSVGTALHKAYPDVEYTSRRTETPNRNRIWARWNDPDDPELDARRNLRSVGEPGRRKSLGK